MKTVLTKNIENFVENYPTSQKTETRWGKPLIGFADANDPLFNKLNQVASPTHAVPKDFLAEAQTVIAFFLPFKKDMTRTNIKDKNSSREWGVGYIETNEMIKQLSLHLETSLEDLGHKSVVIPATHNWDEKKLISDWSHRHVAYIAGLGRFGLNNMLITDQGSCGRFGSFITSANVKPDTRPQEESCLYKYDGSCKKCVNRCVNDALHESSFDRFKCYDMLLENVEKLKDIGYADVCGKCLVAVPCSHMNPVAMKNR